VAQRLVGHHRPEVGAADADVDHVADRLVGVAAPLAAAHPVGEGAHSFEHLVDLLDHVLPVDDQRAVARHPQRHVQDGAVLGGVDVLAAEHRLAPLGDAAFPGQVGEQGQRLVGDPVLGVVAEETGRLERQPLAPLRIGGEQVTEVPAADLGVVALERAKALALAQLAHDALTRAWNTAWISSRCLPLVSGTYRLQNQNVNAHIAA